MEQIFADVYMHKFKYCEWSNGDIEIETEIERERERRKRYLDILKFGFSLGPFFFIRRKYQHVNEL